MKDLLIIFLMILSIPAKTFAQAQAFAVCSTGILESKFKITYNPKNKDEMAVNIAADTISLAEAQSIFALNVIGRDTSKLLVKLKVKDWQMFLKNGADTATYRGDGEMLTFEMKDALKKIRPGTEIYFEYIYAALDKAEYKFAVPAIEYFVKP